jgi:probable phosphoglycerate mutase
MNGKIKALIIILLTICSMTESLAADVYLYLTRHGKTVHRAQGWADTPLTSEGVEEAQKLGRGLQSVKFIAAWSSDAGRARETAQLAMQGWKKPLPLQESRGLREVNFGLFEGDLDETMLDAAAKQVGYPSQAALMTAFADRKIRLDQMIDAIKSAEAQGTEALKGIKSTGAAESYRQTATRMTRSITDIAQQAQRQGGGNVLVVSQRVSNYGAAERAGRHVG